MDRGAWWATVHGVEKEQDTTEHTHTHTYTHTHTHTHTHTRAITFKVMIDIIELMSTMFITFFYSLSEASLSALSGVNGVCKIILFNLLSFISTSLKIQLQNLQYTFLNNLTLPSNNTIPLYAYFRNMDDRVIHLLNHLIYCYYFIILIFYLFIYFQLCQVSCST